MPLVRFEVRNEYGLGQPELYKEANREDPKAVLDGVAVAGLVGILRQLGDLAEFAADVFHGLQEQVMTTASRSHKLMVRVQNIEAALPPLEKTVLAQTSHIHFAYTAGSEWHPRVPNEQNHFIYNDLPRFIMDSYEECRDPPHLHLLDKFDTGGPGSCLKRYSDPTFFRRVSGNFKEPDAEKVPKDKKARKSKKKRSSQRNGDLLRCASIPNHSGRMQITPPIVNGRTSPSHTASTIDTTLKSDMGDHSNSLDSRTGSGYIECVFHLNSAVQPEEQESKEFSSSFKQYNDIPDSVFHDGEPGVAYDDFPHSSSPEQIAPSSSCVTWDEKVEIVEPNSQNCDGDEAPEMLATDSGMDTQGTKIANLGNPDPLDVVFADTNTPTSSSSRIRDQHDEVESEPDNYMDALNTIESESENDIDCQTKHEVEQFSSNVSNGVEDGTREVTAHISDHHPSKNEYPSASSNSSNKEMSCELPNSVPSVSFPHEHTSHISGKSSNSDYAPDIEGSTSADALDGAQVESVVSDPSSSGSGISNPKEPTSDETISSSCKSQESQADFSGVPSVTFWTNGGLLGLEPSKPPDFAVSNTKSNDYLTRSKGEVVGSSNHTFMPSNDGERGKPGRLDKDAGSMERVPSSKCSTSRHGDQDNKVEKSSDSHHSHRFNHAYEGGLNHIHAATPGNELLHGADVKDTCIEVSQENGENSSQMFGFGHRLFGNGFQRNMSLASSGKPEPASSLKTVALEQSYGHNKFVFHDQATPDKALKEQFGCNSFVDSLTSSPPLEHMKISFHPIHSFESSKLELKFPNEGHCNESVRDMLPSFQLVPDPAVPLHDVGSDSDDDTFCRSSPYISDDCLSHHSESDSEQWESGESPESKSPESKDHELYDALCRISPVESVSSSLQPGETANDGVCIDSGLKIACTENGADLSLPASFLDLPSFDAVNPVVKGELEAVNPVLKGESKANLDQRNLLELQFPRESTPLPPPLPPVQWRVLKSHSDVAEDKQHAISEAREHAFYGKLMGPTVSQQPKSVPANKQETNEEAIAFNPKSEQHDEQKLNWQQEANQPADGKGMDEKEDFLHQIRTKSFTLRRTATAKPTVTSGTPANGKVTAILEKANAIRQAVGSDDGEDDDNWSDT